MINGFNFPLVRMNEIIMILYFQYLRTRQPCLRIMWLFVTLIGLSVSMYFLYRQILSFTKHTTATSIKDFEEEVSIFSTPINTTTGPGLGSFFQLVLMSVTQNLRLLPWLQALAWFTYHPCRHGTYAEAILNQSNSFRSEPILNLS